MKKALAVILSVIILFGWYATLMGIGSFAPIKDQIKLGLDLSGGVYVVMEAQTDLTGAELKKTDVADTGSNRKEGQSARII
jgi:preprotein translocase subunit SecD